MAKTIVYLANLTHVNEDGILATESMPLNLGYLAAYAAQELGDEFEFQLFTLPSDLTEAVKNKRPHILGGSNYLWSSNLNYHYLSYFKKLYPDLVTVMGGPTFSYTPERRKEYLLQRPELDFYVTDEGEISFTGLLRTLVQSGMSIEKAKADALDGCHFIRDGQLVSGRKLDRIKDLNIIPSPYLGGYLDKFLDDGLTPILQSNRGCPFACAYCCSAVPYYNKIASFSVERVNSEIEYMAARVKSPSIHIHDDNFGMFKQDYEICLKFKEMQDKYKWPLFISAATGKNSKEKILRCVELLGSSIPFSASVQTMSPKALKLISRDNMRLEDFLVVQQRVKEVGGRSNSELILPLPGETYESHLEGIRTIIAAGIDTIGPYTTMVLPASPLAEEGRFDKEEMLFKYRVIPRDFGRYEGVVVVEAECVCVATKDLLFEEYVSLRGMHFILYCFYNGETFRELINYLRAAGIEIYEYIWRLWTDIGSAHERVQEIFNQFLADTRNELWNSEEEIYRHYSVEENYQKLLSMEEGANLLQKYSGRFFSSGFDNSCEYAFRCAKIILDESGVRYDPEALSAIHTYTKMEKSGLFDIANTGADIELSYNVHAWKSEGYQRPLSEYQMPVKITFRRTQDQIDIISEYRRIYGDTEDGMGKALTRVDPKKLFWRAQVAILPKCHG